MSRVIRFHRTGGPEVLQIDEIDVPAPGANEVQINVRALGINRAEVSTAQASTSSNRRFPPCWAMKRLGPYLQWVPVWSASLLAMRSA